MRIRLTKKRNSTSVRFTATNDSEGFDLKDVVMGMPNSPSEALVTDAIEKLGERGYKGELTRKTRNTKEFNVTKEPAK